MPSLLKKKAPAKAAPVKEKANEPTKPLDERPVPTGASPRQSENSFLAFTIQRKHDGVTNLYELVQVRIEKAADGNISITEVRRDPGTMREIVESKIFRDLSEIVF